jgi:hypothetical protein
MSTMSKTEKLILERLNGSARPLSEVTDEVIEATNGEYSPRNIMDAIWLLESNDQVILTTNLDIVLPKTWVRIYNEAR